MSSFDIFYFQSVLSTSLLAVMVVAFLAVSVVMATLTVPTVQMSKNVLVKLLAFSVVATKPVFKKQKFATVKTIVVKVKTSRTVAKDEVFHENARNRSFGVKSLVRALIGQMPAILPVQMNSVHANLPTFLSAVDFEHIPRFLVISVLQK